MDDSQFKKLLNHFHYSWTGYRKVRKAVKKRISRHMQQLRCSNINEYMKLLDTNEQYREECKNRMTVSISRFFRDRKLWFDLENELLPSLIVKQTDKQIDNRTDKQKGKQTGNQKDRIKVWFAGCARGEEVYSFKIVWDQLNRLLVPLPELALTATDMHFEYIENAKAGVYTKSSLKEVPDRIRGVYFDIKRGGRQFAIKPVMKENINWQVSDIFFGPPDSDFDIVFLRNNLLTYYETHLVNHAFVRIIESLRPGGFLIIGSHERLPEASPGLKSGLTKSPSILYAYHKTKGEQTV